jgi:alpha-L-fucosidase 2
MGLTVLVCALAGAAPATNSEPAETVVLSGLAPAPEGDLTLWYRQPARRWREALPIGNGRFGGMVWGRVQHERIDLNEDTLWSGEPEVNLNTNGRAAFPIVRGLLLAGKNAEAQAMVEQQMNGHYDSSYMPLGWLGLDFPMSGAVKDYRRELDISRAVTTVEFEYEGAHYTREVFASHPGQAMVVRLSADKPGRISCTVTLDSLLRHECRPVGGEQEASLAMTGRSPAYVDPNFLGKKVVYEDALNGKGTRFEARLMARHEGGTVTASNQTVVASGCDSLTVLLVAATSYNGPEKSPSAEGKEPAKLCEAALKEIGGRSYKRLLKEHVADYQELFGRVSLRLEGEKAGNLGLPGAQQAGKPAVRQTLSALRRPTDERVATYQSEPELAALYYQFGRYLLIACSRPGGQPANLQGLWSPSLQAAWSANWTLNCNAEINYWPVETANLGECHLPLVRLTEELSRDGAFIARELYGMRGWVAHHNTDIWRRAGPVGGSACWSMFPMGGAWLCQHLWEHYAFTGDKEYLRRVWPTLRGAARFYLDYLVEEPKHHWLVTGPDVNFENPWLKPNGEKGCTCLGPTGSMQMIRELFGNCLKAMAVLETRGKGNAELVALRTELESALPRLAPMRISPTTGELQEWMEDWQRTAECQVLSSWGLICSAQITPRGTPEYAAGLKRIFDSNSWWKQGKVGSWQGAFQANAYARLGDGEMAWAILEKHFQSSVNSNLLASFPGHTQYQIDGNLGQTAAIGEMLLQSQVEENGVRVIELLPALPKAWAGGEVSGLRARGGFEMGLKWERGALQEVSLKSTLGNPCKLRLGGREIQWPTKRGGRYRFGPNLVRQK